MEKKTFIISQPHKVKDLRALAWAVEIHTINQRKQFLSFFPPSHSPLTARLPNIEKRKDFIVHFKEPKRENEATYLLRKLFFLWECISRYRCSILMFLNTKETQMSIFAFNSIETDRTRRQKSSLDHLERASQRWGKFGAQVYFWFMLFLCYLLLIAAAYVLTSSSKVFTE